MASFLALQGKWYVSGIYQRANRYLLSFHLALQNVLPITQVTSMGGSTEITGQACFLSFRLFPQALDICVPR